MKDVMEHQQRIEADSLYTDAPSVQLKTFIGIDSPHQPSEDPQIRIDTPAASPEEAAELVIAKLLGDEG